VKVGDNYYDVTIKKEGKKQGSTYTYSYVDSTGAIVSATSTGNDGNPPT
jgi:hypothetical protein